MSVARLLVLGVVLALVPAVARAQNPQCDPHFASSQTYNVCNAAIDGTAIFTPVVGLAVSGGSPVIGTARTLGGFFHLSIALRANATQVVTPALGYDGSSRTVAQGSKVWAGTPNVDGAFGLFKGLKGGLLSIDALGSALLIPTGIIDNLTVDPTAPHIGSVALGLGYGGRVGISNGRGPVPAISVSYMHRHVPRISYGDVGGGDNYQYSSKVNADNLRLSAGYKLSILNLIGGIGWDHYTGSSTILFRDPITTLAQPPIDVLVKRSRTIAYLGAALDLPVVKIAAEAGWQVGKAESLYTSFDGNDPSKTRFFVGAGLRFSF